MGVTEGLVTSYKSTLKDNPPGVTLQPLRFIAFHNKEGLSRNVSGPATVFGLDDLSFLHTSYTFETFPCFTQERPEVRVRVAGVLCEFLNLFCSLSFVNSGMVQFKPVFQVNFQSKQNLIHHPSKGRRSRPCARGVNSQRCVRVGGKHNDLSVVGNDFIQSDNIAMTSNSYLPQAPMGPT